MDKLQSDMDTSVQTELKKMVGRQGMTMTLLKQEKAKLIQSLQTNAGPYRSKFAQLQKLRRVVQTEQAKLHHVVCTFLAAFDLRVLPWLESDQLLQTQGARSLSAANRRKLSFLAHGKFRTRLVHTLGDPLRRSNRIVWTSEEYTSKLCSRCFRYCGYLAGSRTFKCPHADCGVHVERDGNAARNIFQWALLRGAIPNTQGASGSGGEAKKPPKKKQKQTIKQQPSYTLTSFGVRGLMASSLI